MVTCAMNLSSPSEIPLIRFIIPDTQFYLSMSTRTYTVDGIRTVCYVKPSKLTLLVGQRTLGKQFIA